MKKYIYFIALALTASLFTACSHDYNYDDEYDVKGYFSGNDPRNNLVYFTTKTAEYTNSFIGELHLGDDTHTFTFNAAVSRNLTNAAKVQVTYAADAPLLATTYKDYQVATAEQVGFNNNGTVDLGTDAVKFDVPVTVKGLASMTKPTVVPFRITPSEGGELSSPEVVRQDYGYIVIKPKDVWTVTYDTQDVLVDFGDGESKYLENNNITVLLSADSKFEHKGQIGLERDNSIFKNDGNTKLAPEGIFTAEKVDCEGKDMFTVSATFSHPEKFTAMGDYVLPLRAVYYDDKGVKHNLINGEVLIPIKVMNVCIVEEEDEPEGTEISATGWLITPSPVPPYGDIDALTDDNTQTGIYMGKGITNIVVDLGQKENIKGIQLGMRISAWQNYYPHSVKFYAGDDNVNWKPLSSNIAMQENEWNNFTVLKSLSTRYLKLEFKVTDAYGSLSEIKIFK